ncbi:MAG: aconitate hydratase [Sedimentisphaerales bacterium]|nr:aconitate hydratase [Sedimentisphaerales bacterium]
MPDNITYKILRRHLREGKLECGSEIGIRIDQTLTQDATGTTAMLLFESMGIERVKTDISVSYVDHNMAMFGPENHDDHLYLQSIARRAGIHHSRPGNGICHQVHLERFARPAATQLGSDSHTPTTGGIGALSIGAGGLDVAVAMGGGLFYLTAPKVIGIQLTGKLNDWVAAKDIILKVLGILTTKGNVGCVAEYLGEGVASLSVPQRATITNMGAELGVTTSIFPSDERTRVFLASQDREADYEPLTADPDAHYEHMFTINLSELEPLAALPSSPDHVKPVGSCGQIPVHQVIIGSCTNSSYRDLATVAAILKGRTVHPQVEFALAPGSRQVLEMLAGTGALSELIRSGARILESACGPCIGQGQSPGSGKVSVRSFNRNFPGRSGTPDDQVYLVSPETAAATALTGRLTDPRRLAEIYQMAYPRIAEPAAAIVDDRLIETPLPPEEAARAQVIRSASIVTPPAGEAPPAHLKGNVLIRCGDKITTDHIMPAGSFLKYRSNVPEYAKYVFHCFNEDGQNSFAKRALAIRSAGRHGVIVAGDSYGQGSSREHAALCPMYLGIRLVIAKSIERIHKANLVNFAITPATFADPADYDRIEQGDRLEAADFAKDLKEADRIRVKNLTQGFEFECNLDLTTRERAILLAGGRLLYARGQPGHRR